MQTLFVPQTEFPFDAALLERTRQTASVMAQSAEQGQYTQGLVLVSSTGKEYGSVIKNALSKEKAEEKALIAELKANNDTALQYVLCMWQDGSIDVPSMAFRKMLCNLNPQNTHALLFVMTQNGISAVRLADTMK